MPLALFAWVLIVETKKVADSCLAGGSAVRQETLDVRMPTPGKAGPCLRQPLVYVSATRC